jgi:TetR/AcrR family transcriptional repressor of nem operon
MRYAKNHKAETHAKIVRNASTQLREKGTRGIGVADLMKEAGLTHGGFYAHFGSREDLVIEAIAYAMDQTTGHWTTLVADKPAGERLALLIDTYLTALHRDNPGRGCVVPALAADIGRESGKTRRVFLAKLEEMIAVFAAKGAGAGAADAEARRTAIATIATLMGTVVLARVAGTGTFSQEILDAGRAAALAGIAGAGDGNKSAAKPRSRVGSPPSTPRKPASRKRTSSTH